MKNTLLFLLVVLVCSCGVIKNGNIKRKADKEYEKYEAYRNVAMYYNVRFDSVSYRRYSDTANYHLRISDSLKILLLGTKIVDGQLHMIIYPNPCQNKNYKIICIQ